jgi:hypothetical protein
MKTEKDEPVAWLNKSRNLLSWDKVYEDMDALYTHPKEWVGLTNDEIYEFDIDPVEAKRMIAKLKEKNGY